MTFEFAPKKEEGKEGGEPAFASNLSLNFRVLLRAYWTEQVHSLITGIEIDLCYQNQNVSGRKGLKNGGCLILSAVRNFLPNDQATGLGFDI